ncbi:cytochrome c peroxidase [Acetobacter sp.]|uniref:cytochrome c peroxidase n=1 Tax=Acetobacter sp. TaxID=440 RepID=UPI0039ECEF18
MSCATCHNQKHAFAESNATHMGVTNEEGIRNVPSLANISRTSRPSHGWSSISPGWKTSFSRL